MSQVAAAPRARRAAPSTSRFAAAFGLESPKEDDKPAAEKPERKEGESDEDYDKRCKAAEEKETPEAGAEEDEPAAETEEDKKEAAAEARGFTAGGQRWADVLGATEAKGKGVIACHLLATTTMSAGDIRAALTAMQPDARAAAPGIGARMGAEPVIPPAPNAPAAPTDATGMVTSEAVVAAAARARGETK